MADYPTNEELKKVEEYEFHSTEDVTEFLEFLRSIWWAPDWGFIYGKTKKFQLHTGGWSGNEDIIDALKSNFMFWSIAWKVHRVGGHFYFDLRPFYRKRFWKKGATHS